MVLQYFLYQEYAAWLASRETSIAMCRAGDVMLFWGGAWFGAIWRAENQIMAVTGGESWSWSLNMYIIYYIYIIIYMCIIQCCVSWLITVSLDIYRYLYLSNYVWYYDMILMSLVVSPTRISESLIFTCVTCQATHTLARMAWARVPVWHSSMALSYARTNRKGVLLAELRGVGNPDDEFQRSRNFLGQNLAWWF